MKNDWQPIESAPRDVPFLAFEGEDIYKCQFSHQDPDTREVFFLAFCGQPVAYSPEPTHWMPLPAQPVVAHLSSKQYERPCSLPIVVLNRARKNGDFYFDGFIANESCDGDFARLAQALGSFAYEPDTVAEYIALLSGMAKGAIHEKTHLQVTGFIDEADNMADAFHAAAVNGQREALFFVYFDNLWHHGVLSESDYDEPKLDRLIDGYSVPTSMAFVDQLDDLALGENDILGPSHIIDHAVQLVERQRVGRTVNYESHPALQKLCQWWNDITVSETACAALFLLYVWDEKNKLFIPGDIEEPPLGATDVKSLGSVAYFRYESTTLAVVFGKGEEHHFVNEEGCITALTASGSFLCSAYCELAAFNISRISMQSLQRLPHLVRQLATRDEQSVPSAP